MIGSGRGGAGRDEAIPEPAPGLKKKISNPFIKIEPRLIRGGAGTPRGWGERPG